MIDQNYSAQMGATALALFFLALAAGRILILPLANKYSPTQMVLTSSILIILSLFFIGFTSFALLGFTIMGFVCGPVFQQQWCGQYELIQEIQGLQVL